MRTLLALLTVIPGALPAQTGPSFDCTQKLTSTVEQRICKDPKLAALDRKLAEAYGAAEYQATAADKQALANDQRAWVRTRNDCWKSPDVPACVDHAYHDRIADLTARYRLMEPVGIGRYLCPGPPAQEAVAEFYNTDPPTALVQYAARRRSCASRARAAERATPAASASSGSTRAWRRIKWSASAPEVSCPKK